MIPLLKLIGDDPNQSLFESASFGRDADTIASISGSLVGAIYGADALKSELITQCEAANVDLFKEVDNSLKPGFEQTASRLIDVIKGEQAKASERAKLLFNMVD